MNTHRHRLHAGVALAALLLAAPLARPAAATTTTILPGNVPSWAATAVANGAAPDSRKVTLILHMTPQNRPALQQLAHDVSTPSSPAYGKYLTKAAFAARFAPLAADVATARAFLTNAGMTNVHVGAANAYVSATATVAQLRATFDVTQNLYTHAGIAYRANAQAPSIPTALAGRVTWIEGLDDSALLRVPMHLSATAGKPTAPGNFRPDVAGSGGSHITPPPVATNLPSPYCDTYFGDLRAHVGTGTLPYGSHLPWLGCGYTPAQIAAAYGMDQTEYTGKGVTVAILDAYASPTMKADANAYAKNHGLPPLTKANYTEMVPPGIYKVDPAEACGPYGWWGEESLDVAAVHGSAPGAKIVYVGARDCTTLGTALSDAVMNRVADIMTNSYSYNGEGYGPQLAADDETFMAADAMGITLLFSSGDNGDLSQLNGIATGSYDADSPYVTAVGGTTLGLTDSSGSKFEWGWGTYRDYLANAQVLDSTHIKNDGLVQTTAFGVTFPAMVFYSGAGGGVSTYAAQPDYQAGIVPDALSSYVTSANGTQSALGSPHRVSPDVSMLADPYTGYLIGESFTIAGNQYADHGCTPTSATTEYCEIPFGGTSLASPLLAGVMAIVNQAHAAAGRPAVGFANPWLYSGHIGAGLKAAGVNDIVPPVAPVAVLRGYANDLTRVRVVTVNSVSTLINTAPYALQVCGLTICEGINDIFNYTTTGYDNVTGLGVPWVPNLITQ